MKKLYIILLQNKYLLFQEKKPVKRGNYMAGVKLYETSSDTSCLQINKWCKNDYVLSSIKEVEDWK